MGPVSRLVKIPMMNEISGIYWCNVAPPALRSWEGNINSNTQIRLTITAYEAGRRNGKPPHTAEDWIHQSS